MPLGASIADFLRSYEEGLRREAFGPDYREKQALEQERLLGERQSRERAATMAPLEQRRAELGIETGEASLGELKTQAAERKRRMETMQRLETEGKLPTGWSASPEAAQWIEGAGDRATARAKAQRELEVAPTGAEARRRREADLGVLGGQAEYYRGRGEAAGARADQAPYTGAAVPQEQIQRSVENARNRLKAEGRMASWTQEGLKEGSLEFNKAMSEAIVNDLRERGYTDEAIAKAGLRLPPTYIRDPQSGDCYMVQGRAVGKVDCKLVEEEQKKQAPVQQKPWWEQLERAGFLPGAD